jgi:hypothetical protein
LLGAPTSLASIMAIGPHHAAVTHVGDSPEVGQRKHMVRQGFTGKCWSEFLCLGDYLAPPRQVGGRAPLDATGRHPPPPTPAAGAPPGPVAGANLSKARADKKKQTRRGQNPKTKHWALKTPPAPTALRGSTYRGHIEHRAQSTEHRARRATQICPVEPISQYMCKQAGGAVFAVVYCT